jgi:hypothetical protein
VLVKKFVIPSTAESEKRAEREIRDFVRQWVRLLADQKYAEALAALSAEIPSGSGSVDSRRAAQWTPKLLGAVIANYGTPEPIEGQFQRYSVVPLDDSLSEAFDANLSIDFDREAIANLDAEQESSQDTKPQGWLSSKLSLLRKSPDVAKRRKNWIGDAEFALPLNLERGNDLSDLSVRMRFKPFTKAEMVLVLLDIHVL